MPGRPGAKPKPKPKPRGDDWPQPPKYPMPTGPKDKMPRFIPAKPPGAPIARPGANGKWGNAGYIEPVAPKMPGTSRVSNQASVKKTISSQAKSKPRKTTARKGSR